MSLKKFFFTVVMLFTLSFSINTSVNAQIIRADELEKYAKEQYGEKWIDAAKNLSTTMQLDKNNAITYVQIIEAPNKSKEQLYVLLNYWFSATFNDANSVIQLNDKELGTIIAQGFVPSIAQHTGGVSTYNVNIKPVIKCDIKDNKIRVTYTVPYYTVNKTVGGGAIAAMSRTAPVKFTENWTIDKCFPFSAKDSHKKTSSKALVMAHAYSNILMDKIEECITNGLSGNENENW